MTDQEIKNINGFIKDLQKMSRNIYMATDAEVAADVALKTNKAVKLINDLANENDQLRNAFHDLTGKRW